MAILRFEIVIHIFLTLIMIAISAAATRAEADESVSLSAPPRIVERYGDFALHELASYLSVSLQRPVEFVAASSVEAFIAQSKADSYELVVDEAHVSAWRIRQLDHEPLVQLADAQRSVVVSRINHPDVFSVADLSGRVLCASSTAQAGLRQFIARWARPFAGPSLRVSSDYSLEDGTCDAFIQSLPAFRAADFDNTKRILTVTSPLPGLTLTGSPRLEPAFRQSIVRELLVNEGVGVVQTLLGETGADTPALATRENYGGLDRFAPPDYE